MLLLSVAIAVIASDLLQSSAEVRGIAVDPTGELAVHHRILIDALPAEDFFQAVQRGFQFGFAFQFVPRVGAGGSAAEHVGVPGWPASLHGLRQPWRRRCRRFLPLSRGGIEQPPEDDFPLGLQLLLATGDLVNHDVDVVGFSLFGVVQVARRIQADPVDCAELGGAFVRCGVKVAVVITSFRVGPSGRVVV